MIQNKKITIDDIARDLNISKTTVSRAISGKGRIGQETREKVLRYIHKNNYRPSAIAKGLAQSKTFNIGFVIPGDYSIVELPFFQKCMWGISNTASTMDYDVIVTMIKEGDISQLVRLIDNHKVDGIILGRTLEKDEPEEYLKSEGIPFVTVGSSKDKSVLQVDNDHLSACSELTSILIHKGIKKIALVGGNMSHMVNQSRLKGYMAAYKEADIRLDSTLIYTEIDSVAKIEGVVDELLKKKVECILCMDDSICNYVLNKLNRELIRIPEDIKVASFYNSSLLTHNQPAITSLQFDASELGMACCNTLLAHLDGQKVPGKTLLGYEVIMKESTKI